MAVSINYVNGVPEVVDTQSTPPQPNIEERLAAVLEKEAADLKGTASKPVPKAVKP